jgi:hypothetical protein
MIEFALFILALLLGAGSMWLVGTHGDDERRKLEAERVRLRARNRELLAALASVELLLANLTEVAVRHESFLARDIARITEACRGATEADEKDTMP